MKKLAILIRQAETLEKALENLDTVITACLFDCSIQLIFFDETLVLTVEQPYIDKLKQIQELGELTLHAVVETNVPLGTINEQLIEKASSTDLQAIIRAADEVVSL